MVIEDGIIMAEKHIMRKKEKEDEIDDVMGGYNMKDKESQDKKKDPIDYNDVFAFFKDYQNETLMDLKYFYDFCRFLRIPDDIRKQAKDILLNKEINFSKVRNYRKFKNYIAAFYVSYVLLREDYDEFICNLKVFVNALVNRQESEIIYISKRTTLKKMLNTMLIEGYSPSYVDDCIDNRLRAERDLRMYKIEINKLIREIIKNQRSASLFNLNINDFIELIIYIIEQCFGDFNYCRGRFTVACFFLLSKHMNWNRNEISLEIFLRHGRIELNQKYLKRFRKGERNLQQLEEEQFKEDLELIDKKINYIDLKRQSDKFDFKDEEVIIEKKSNSTVESIIRERLRNRGNWKKN